MAVVGYLKSADGGRPWLEMVKSYLELESEYRLRVSRYSSQLFPLLTSRWPRTLNDYLHGLALKKLPNGDVSLPPCHPLPTFPNSRRSGSPGGGIANQSGGLSRRGRFLKTKVRTKTGRD